MPPEDVTASSSEREKKERDERRGIKEQDVMCGVGKGCVKIKNSLEFTHRDEYLRYNREKLQNFCIIKYCESTDLD